MGFQYIDFEQPIAELEEKIHALSLIDEKNNVDIKSEISRLKVKSRKLTQSIFASLTAAQVLQLARHPERLHTRDYIDLIFTDFDELYGDRHYSAGREIIGGIGRLDGQPVMVIGHEKGRGVKEKIKYNFGMPKPESYRKSLRLLQLAERFQLPVLTFVDTPGAYPGVKAEESNQSEAIARNLLSIAQLRTPIIVTVIGEGGSGGALAIGIGDYMLMLEYSVYSVISPEGCASILWKDAARAKEAAEAMGITAKKLLELKLIDRIIPEPLGGAHRDKHSMASTLKSALVETLQALNSLSIEALMSKRRKQFRAYGT